MKLPCEARVHHLIAVVLIAPVGCEDGRTRPDRVQLQTAKPVASAAHSQADETTEPLADQSPPPLAVQTIPHETDESDPRGVSNPRDVPISPDAPIPPEDLANESIVDHDQIEVRRIQVRGFGGGTPRRALLEVDGEPGVYSVGDTVFGFYVDQIKPPGLLVTRGQRTWHLSTIDAEPRTVERVLPPPSSP